MQRAGRLLKFLRREKHLVGKSSVQAEFSTSTYDPPYLDDLKPKVELCEPFNVKITGPDFPIVESYQKLIHRIVRIMDADVSDNWAVPPRKARISRFKPSSTNVDAEYQLYSYERNLQIVDLPNNLAPILIEMAQAALPQSVTIEVKYHTDQDELDRYVPDIELAQLKSELDAAGGPLHKKR